MKQQSTHHAERIRKVARRKHEQTYVKQQQVVAGGHSLDVSQATGSGVGGGVGPGLGPGLGPGPGGGAGGLGPFLMG